MKIRSGSQAVLAEGLLDVLPVVDCDVREQEQDEEEGEEL